MMVCPGSPAWRIASVVNAFSEWWMTSGNHAWAPQPGLVGWCVGDEKAPRALRRQCWMGGDLREDPGGASVKQVSHVGGKQSHSSSWPGSPWDVSKWKVVASGHVDLPLERTLTDVWGGLCDMTFFLLLLVLPNFLFIYFILFLLLGIGALQFCVTFYCTAKWISYTCTYIPSFLDFLPI